MPDRRLPDTPSSKRSRCRLRWRAAALGLGLLLSAGAGAQWNVVQRSELPYAGGAGVAEQKNDAGHLLQVYRDEGNEVRLRFTLRPGLKRLAPGSCPTFHVNEREPMNRSEDGSSCLAGLDWAEFVIARIDGNRSVSLPLHWLMNGDTVAYRYRLEHGGYQETRFGLRGSNRAIGQALGRVRVEPR